MDPWCWNFLQKPQEANWGHCWSTTTAVWLTPWIQSWKERGVSAQGTREGVNFGSGVCQNLLRSRWCISACDCSRQVKLWTWVALSQCGGTFELVEEVQHRAAQQSPFSNRSSAAGGERGGNHSHLEWLAWMPKTQLWPSCCEHTEALFRDIYYLDMQIRKMENVPCLDLVTQAPDHCESDLLYSIIWSYVSCFSTKVTVKLHVKSSYNQVLNRNPDLQSEESWVLTKGIQHLLETKVWAQNITSLPFQTIWHSAQAGMFLYRE